MAAVLLLCGARALPAPQEVSNLMAPPQFQPPLKTLQEGLGEPAVVREALEPRAGEVPTGQPLAGEVPTGQPVAGEPAALEPAEPPNEKSPKEIIHQIDGSTFCFMVYKVGVEDDVVRYMFKNHIGVFGCDEHAVFSLFDASDPSQPGCKYGGSMDDGCLIDGGAGATSKPLVFNMSLLPPLDESKAIGGWVAQKFDAQAFKCPTQVRRSPLVRQSNIYPQATRLDWGNDGRWLDPQAGKEWGAQEKERKNDKRTPAEKQADAERKIKKAEEEIKKAEEDNKKAAEADLDTVKKAQEENQKAADEAAAAAAKEVADAQKEIDKAAKANEEAADAARAAAAKDVEDAEKAQKAAEKAADASLDDASKKAAEASDAEQSAAVATAASDMDAAQAEAKIAEAAASAQATEEALAPADGEGADGEPRLDCVSTDPASVTDEWCTNTCSSASAAGTSVCSEEMCVCGEDAETARATAAAASGSTFEDETAAESDAAEAAAAEKAADGARVQLVSNTPIFLAAWRSLFDTGTLFEHEWVVKVDADTVFLPDRLKDWLPAAIPDPMRVSNCLVPIAANTPDKSLTIGAIEVINVAAARAYQLAMDECEESVPLDHGEDHFLHQCASDDWQVFDDAAASKGMVMDPACETSFKAGCALDSVSFHPYRDLEEFELCHNETKKITSQQKKDAAESWTAVGDDAGMPTGVAHHGAYEKDGLKTVKQPARVV